MSQSFYAQTGPQTRKVTLKSGGEVVLEDGRSVQIRPMADGSFKVVLENRVVNASLISRDAETKTYRLLVGQKELEVRLSTETDRMMEKLGVAAGASSKLADLKAPMPGLVKKINVQPGQAVEKGTALLLLEAMKMENVIKATGAGTVKSIEAVEGAAVEKGQVLIRFA